MHYQINEVFTFSELSQIIFDMICNNRIKTIGITGMSCVGKSTLASSLKEMLIPLGSTQIICADNFLWENIRGENAYLNTGRYILEPQSYNWESLRQSIDKINDGESVVINCYKRGVGWNFREVLSHADYYIVEGLFLNSLQAISYLGFDLLIELYADECAIKKLRVIRDTFYRSNYENFTRSIEESIHEANYTIIAYNNYKKYNDQFPYIGVFVDYDTDFKYKLLTVNLMTAESYHPNMK